MICVFPETGAENQGCIRHKICLAPDTGQTFIKFFHNHRTPPDFSFAC